MRTVAHPHLRNHYAVLGVRPSADITELSAAFRARAKQLHPDLVDGDAERFKELSHAYRVLTDPSQRRRYDAARGAPGTVVPSEPPAPSSPPPAMFATAGRARSALWGGLVLVIIGVLLAVVVPFLGDATRGSTLGRDITLWVAAAKLLVGGSVLAVVGRRRVGELRAQEPGSS